MKARKIKNQCIRDDERFFKLLRRKHGTKCRMGDADFCYAQRLKEYYEKDCPVKLWLEQRVCASCYVWKYSKLATKRFKYKFLRNKRCWRDLINNECDG